MDTLDKQMKSNSPSLDEEFINECIKDINDDIEKSAEEVVEEEEVVVEEEEVVEEVIEEVIEEIKEEVVEEEESYEKLLVGEDIMWTSNPRVEIKREVTDDIKPITLYDALSNTVSKYGNLPAYTYNVGNQQVTKTWSKFYIYLIASHLLL